MSTRDIIGTSPDVDFCIPTRHKRVIRYWEAVREAIDQSMAEDARVLIFGEGVNDSNGIYGTTKGLVDKYRGDRVFETPLSEAAMTGIGVGAALMGLRPLHTHIRMDFLLLCMDQICNHAAKWSYMTGGQVRCPLTIRALISRGWGSAAQHSQSFYSIFAHIPGLRVLLPVRPVDAKTAYLDSLLKYGGPTLIIEHRWLHKTRGGVPEGKVDLDLSPRLLRSGKDITLLGISMGSVDCMMAADVLRSKYKISAEVLDLFCVKPLDLSSILISVKKTGHLVIVDVDHTFCGMSAEIAAQVYQSNIGSINLSIARIGLPDCPTPASESLEEAYYPGVDQILESVLRSLRR